MLPSMFKKKHQKLILQCYPSPKLSITETKPNQAELSYLVFYASSRRTKLEKVGNFLLKKTAADISHKRVGHLKVTLYILQELIAKCPEDLGFLTPYVIQIIQQIVNLSDYSTCELACTVFIDFSEKLNPIQRQVFSSDVNVLKQFLYILDHFLKFATTFKGSKEWLQISLKISLCIAENIDHTLSQFENINLIGKSIYLILDTLTLNQTDLTLSKVATIASNLSKNYDDKTIEDLAIAALKSFFDTGSKYQLDTSIKNLLQYIIDKKKEVNWSNNIVIICAKKSHIELRHRILGIITKQIETDLIKNNIETVAYLSKIQCNLLSSENVQFVSLPLIDMFGKVLNFEKSMVLSNESHRLKDVFSDLVRSLFSIVYYKNQINDMLAEVIGKYCTDYSSGEFNDKQFLSYTQVLVDNIRDILNFCEKPNIKLKRSEYSLSLFNYLYLIFSFDKYSNIHQQIQIIWLTFLEEFYRSNPENFAQENIESVITNNNNNGLCIFLEAIDKIIPNSRDEIKAQLSITFSTMIKTFKINFLLNYLKFSSAWLVDIKNFKYSLSLLILGLSASIIDNGDGKALATLADSKIAYIQQQNIWPEYLGYKPSSKPDSNQLTTDELYQVLDKIPEISKWLNVVNITEIPVISKPEIRPHIIGALMSANNSVSSIPLGNVKSEEHSINKFLRNTTDSSHSTMDAMLNGNGYREGDISTVLTNEDSRSLSTSYYNFAQPNRIGATISNMGDSIYSEGRNLRGRRLVNLKELKHNQTNGESDVDFSKLVRTRTGGTLDLLNLTLNSIDTATVKNNNEMNSAENVDINGSHTKKKGLAFAIEGLDLDD